MPPAIPAYLSDVYSWAYLNPFNKRLLDHEGVVSTILFGNSLRLQRAVCGEFGPGASVFQAAAVYGSFCRRLARHLGPAGRLDIIDVAPLQVDNVRRKLAGLPQATVRLADAAAVRGDGYDGACSYFLLHELPADYRRAVVGNLLDSVAPGGRVVFVDYHRPRPAYPLKPVVGAIFDAFEPFAKDMWTGDIKDYAYGRGNLTWRKETYFGVMYQKVVAERDPD